MLKVLHVKKNKALAADGAKYCLLDFVGGDGMVSRPVMQLEFEGEMVWFEYEFEKIYDNDDEALAYAKENNIELMED